MNVYFPFLLACVALAIIIVSTFSKRGKTDPGATVWLILGFVLLVTTFRVYALTVKFELLELYAIGLVGLGYLLSFILSIFFYKDPTTEGLKKGLYLTQRKQRVLYVIPVKNQENFIRNCVESILASAAHARDLAEVRVVVVDDASDDNTPSILAEIAKQLEVIVITLSKNGGKKNALAVGTVGGENWRDAFELFRTWHGHLPHKNDFIKLKVCFREVGCDFWDPDLVFYTDSDSVVSEEFIRNMIIGFSSNEKIGAISGHCDVWLDANRDNHTVIQELQVGWYEAQFRVKKAAESVFNSVFCVSGPGAGFRSEALLVLLLTWVDDFWAGKIYRGATDRWLTLLILINHWHVNYSQLSLVWTMVPQTLAELRSQWIRWKQNFWRMFMPVWKFAWRCHPIVAYMVYSRLLVTAFAPIILGYHVLAFFLGDAYTIVFYLAGIGLMGGIMGLSYVSRNPGNANLRYALYRICISWISALWGSILTVGALIRTINNTFTWRDTPQARKRGRFRNRWFVSTVELQFLEVILIILIIVRLISWLQAR